MFRVFSLLFLLGVGLLIHTPVKAEEKAIVRIVAGAFPPFRGIYENGEKFGIDYEIVDAAFKVMGRSYDFEFLPFLRAMREVELGNAHGIAALTINKERKAFLNFSDPISYVRDVFYAQKDIFPKNWTSFGEFKSVRVGKSKGYNYHASFQEYPFETLMEVVGGDISNELQLLKLTARDRLDVMICEYVVCKYLLSKNPEIAEHVESLDTTIGPVRPFHLGFAKAHPEAEKLLKSFNEALVVLRKNGTLGEIYKKYGLKPR